MQVNEIREILDKEIFAVEITDDTLTFKFTDQTAYRFFHCQDCCEDVWIDDIIGDPNQFVGQKLYSAEERSSSDLNFSTKKDDNRYDESHTWTFYMFVCPKATLDVRWYGTSNGYYSEKVDHKWLEQENQ